MSDLPPSPPHVLHQWPDFLRGVSTWINDLLESNSNLDGLIVDSLRDAPMVWGGVGVYTATELAARAGLLQLSKLSCIVFHIYIASRCVPVQAYRTGHSEPFRDGPSLSCMQGVCAQDRG